MNPEMIRRLAKEAGMVEGPWANGNKERIWQENREFPDALEVFASLIAKECANLILEQKWPDGHEVFLAAKMINEKFGLDSEPESL
jgi:hypothetical protein